MQRSVGGEQFVRSTEVVRFSEGPFSEVTLYLLTAGIDHDFFGILIFSN